MASENFEVALAHVLRHEGGYIDHPADPGGATNMGITQKTLSRWRGRNVSREDVKALTRVEAAAIYRKYYWDVIAGDELPAGIDYALFDYAVNSGTGRALASWRKIVGQRDLQKNPSPPAFSSRDRARFIREISEQRRRFLQGLAIFPTFGRGWIRRVNEVENIALKSSDAKLLPQATEIQIQTPDISTMHIPTIQTGEKTMSSFIVILSNIARSRTVWSNVIGLLALILSFFGFKTGDVDVGKITDTLFQLIACISFIASTFFRIIAKKSIL